MPDPLRNLLELQNKTKFRIWDNFVHALPNFTEINLPENIKSIEHIPMDRLLL